MSIEQRIDPSSATAWEEAEAYGFDMSLIVRNVGLSYEERCRQHDRAINQAMALREAATRQIDGLSGAIEAAARK